MPWLGRLRRTFSARADRDIDEELQFHIETRIDEFVRDGMPLDVARQEALRRFGNVTSTHERTRDWATLRWVTDALDDARLSRRLLRRSPGFTLAVVLTLGLGIGATTSLFTVVNSVLLKPLAYPDSQALVRIAHSIGGREQPYLSDAIYLAYAEHSQAFQDVGVWSPGETAAVTGDGEPEEVPALRANRGLLTTLAVWPEIGRWFSPAEDAPGSPDTVMLTGGYWRRRFGGDPRVLERALTINGRPHQVIGVTPADFRFDTDVGIILPLRINPASPAPGLRLLGVARVKPGVTLAAAHADVSRVLDSLFRTLGNPTARARWAPALTTLKDDVVGDVGTTLWLLLGATSVVLLMACANVAHLQLVRAEARRPEIAIRAALGASRARIACQLATESLVLALIAVLLGIGVAYLGVRALVALGPSNLPRLSELSIDPVVLAFAVTVALVAGLVVALVPILKSGRTPMPEALGGRRSGGTTPGRQRAQQALTAAQLALALVLLVSAALMIRTFQALRGVEPGFTRAEQVQTFTVSIPATLVPDPVRVTRMQQQIVDSLAGVPGVTSVAFATRLPTGSDRSSAALLPEGVTEEDMAAGRTPPNRQVKVISPGLFTTLGTPLVAGRDFTWADVHDRRDVAIVSANLARELWGSMPAALGKRVREYYEKNEPWRQVIGVAADVRDDGPNQPAPATIYWPVQADDHLLSLSAGYQARRITLAIRSERAGTESLLSQLRQAIWSVNPELPVASVRTLDAVYKRSTARTSFTLVMLAIAAAAAMLLGLSGVYGVVSYAVSQRRREIGIRLALGGDAGAIRRLFLRSGAALTAIGIAAGLGGAAVTTRVMQSLLFGVTPLDTPAFAAMAGLLTAAAILASYVPVRRALKVDPIEAMRAE